jgi:hypothetical protein
MRVRLEKSARHRASDKLRDDCPVKEGNAMWRSVGFALTAAALALSAQGATAQLGEKKVLTLAAAQLISLSVFTAGTSSAGYSPRDQA